jgi:hypothetical protein
MSKNTLKDWADIIMRVERSIMEQREEILRAFVTKYDFEPEECEQVIQSKGITTIWFVRRKTK